MGATIPRRSTRLEAPSRFVSRELPVKWIPPNPLYVAYAQLLWPPWRSEPFQMDPLPISGQKSTNQELVLGCGTRKGAAMTTSRYLTVLLNVLPFLLLSGCGPSVPGNSDLDILRLFFAAYGDVLEIRKTNGSEMIGFGGKGYNVQFLLSVRLTADTAYALENKYGGGLSEIKLKSKLGNVNPRVYNVKELPKDTIYAIEGEALFQNTEKGWILQSWDRKRFGYCQTASDASACYKTLGWQF